MRRLFKKIYINIFKKEKMAGRREGGAPAPSIGEPPLLSTVIKCQVNIAELIIMQQKLALLPAREITAFDGDPLNYHVFTRAFEHVIEDKTSSSQDRLYILE
jgi:hypothetical protein